MFWFDFHMACGQLRSCLYLAIRRWNGGSILVSTLLVNRPIAFTYHFECACAVSSSDAVGGLGRRSYHQALGPTT